MRSRRRLVTAPLALAAVVAAVAFAAACGSKDNGGAIQTQSEKAVTSTSAPQSDAYGYPAPSDSSASSTTTTAAAASSSGDTITAKGFSFTTGAAVKAGATVHIDNQDPTTHTVTADDGSSFDTSIDGGTKATFTAPSKPGTYPFHCKIHPSMHGTLTVQ